LKIPKVTEKDNRRARNLLLFDTLHERTGIKRGPLQKLALVTYCERRVNEFLEKKEGLTARNLLCSKSTDAAQPMDGPTIISPSDVFDERVQLP
jgi:hypothetical protein